MHDTPLKNLFGEDFRFHSSGCVRIQNVRELVNWLLGDMPGWSRQEIDQVIRSRRPQGRAAGAAGAGLLGLRHRLGYPDGVVQFATISMAATALAARQATSRG